VERQYQGSPQSFVMTGKIAQTRKKKSTTTFGLQNVGGTGTWVFLLNTVIHQNHHPVIKDSIWNLRSGPRYFPPLHQSLHHSHRPLLSPRLIHLLPHPSNLKVANLISLGCQKSRHHRGTRNGMSLLTRWMIMKRCF